ncbi:hypothetical protein QFW82_46220 [Streptomyces malaysiensis subsp. malaysiensis]|uniref:hypothetical protein n=1 Tax=Streptomyces malaysiensis TaxID=92644 RepID=UPI0024C07B75|nr:hypothetical protein [Streptomyces sp. NA07423]WHX23912.1 hypothetical protein QFW82_46220 [Streptomyces sp. NA07423]
MSAKVRAVGTVGAKRSGKRRGRLGGMAAGGVLALVAVAACGSGSAGPRDGFHPVKHTDGTLTVWVDSTRLAAANLYKARHR